jgi:hypothetical protein
MTAYEPRKPEVGKSLMTQSPCCALHLRTLRTSDNWAEALCPACLKHYDVYVRIA